MNFDEQHSRVSRATEETGMPELIQAKEKAKQTFTDMPKNLPHTDGRVCRLRDAASEGQNALGEN